MQGENDLQIAKTALANGDGGTAFAALNRLLRDQPDHAEGLYLMALCANAAGRGDVAIDCLQKARVAAPDDADIAFSLGSLLAATTPQKALAPFRDAVRLRPDFAPAWTNMGNLLAGMGLLEEAAEAYEQALKADPDLLEVESNLGVIRQSQGRHDDALRHHDHVVRQRPGFGKGQHNRLMSMHYNEGLTSDEIQSAHRAWGQALSTNQADRVAQSAPFAKGAGADRVLRVGYVSPDFRQHPVANFFLPLLEAHDRHHVDVWCYSDAGHPDAMTETLRGRADHWVDTAGWTDDALAERISSDRIDILVDLAGHTSGNRLSVFARRVAPVQMTWLGYPGITGLGEMDYRLTDAVADPPVEADGGEAEQLIRLPSGFLCYRPPVDIPVAKTPLGGRPIVFGSFNNFAKVNGTVLDRWAEILKECPDALLMVKARSLNDPGTRWQCADAFLARGVDPARLRLRGTVPGLAEHFSLYNDIDIALDTFPYNGTTTTFDALWMGTPVIALRGERHAARVGASILTHLGLPELIAEDHPAYISAAVALAGDAARCGDYSARLRDRLRASPLLDAGRFARTIEKTYREKWNVWCHG
ncbi:tetratricopeptide repeat protein [Hwanghaeella grinnelliae]|uniref:protein O-GlcNAc transferase n=1 Tax=Hwanghaeella grinnelliae TaxID=2500179 RepID=A0A437QQC2_9PROT|nr:tetratricopeptide repeat protein [Hwanghaeella grinnelliae]RVU36649.1 tetratricopeptide repeat protein [Hwanghaeella grinnelliae]